MKEILLANVPEGWRVERLGQLFRERKEKVSDKEFPPLSVTKNGIVPQLESAAKTDDGDNRKGVRAGDFVINSRSDRKGSGGLSTLDGSVSLINIVLEPRRIVPRFAHHLLRSHAFQEEFYRWGHGIVADLWTTRYSEMKNIRTAVPDLPTQRAIADFLDREAARIDQLIEKKQRFADLAEAEHQSFVTHAVTAGLDPNSSMKASHHDWHASVPEHWTITRLKFLCRRIVDCLHETPEHDDEGEYPSVRTADIARGRVSLTTAKRVSSAEYQHRIQRLEPHQGDVLYTREGERFGLAALVPPNVKLCLGQRMMMFRPNARVSPAYLMWSLNGDFAYNYLKQSTAGATSPHLNIFDIRNVPVFLPPLVEQQQIISAIDSRYVRKERLIALVSDTITRLREYRAALITAAVTGQIDVRQGAPAMVKTTATHRQRLRVIVGAEIVDQHRATKKFGRVKLQKLLYLAEAHAGIDELGGNYLREAAGPLARDLLDDTESGMNAAGFYRAESAANGNGSGTVYASLQNAGRHRTELSERLGDRAEELARTIHLMKDFDTRAVEAIATLYAVWNDDLIDGKSVSDEAIVKGVLNEWHPEKADKFCEEELRRWLDWMRRNRLVPQGRGPKTTTGRLFA